MISREEVKHIAKLARLGLSEKEIGKFQKELSSILDYFDKLKEVNVSKIKPTSHSQEIENIMRGDRGEKAETDITKKMAEQAPETKDGHWKVKSIL